MQNKTLDKKILLAFIIRFTLPFFVFKYPIPVLLLSLFLDGIDGQLFFDAGYRWKTYNKVDKFLDYWWYIFILIYFGVYVPNVYQVALILFIIRSAGQLLGAITENEKIYIFFPNIIEWFFLLTIAIPEKATSTRLLIAFSMALFVEWLIHFSNLHIISKHIHHREILWQKNEHKNRKSKDK